MAKRDIIVIGGSAGSIVPLRLLLSRLPATLPASVFVLVHRFASSSGDTLLELLQHPGAAHVRAAVNGGVPEPSSVYLAPPGKHLRIDQGVMRTGEELGRPASRTGIDVLFRSAAASYGARVIGVVLSGALDDGTAGLWEVRRTGGVTMVQAPHLAEFPSMPGSAMREVPLHHCLGIAEIADQLRALVDAPAGDSPPRLRVLIVEDERVLAMNIESCLVALGYDVVASVTTAEDALRTAAAALPDVVIMDIHLAGAMRGTEAAQRLSAELGVAIVYLTAYSDDQTLREVTASSPRCGYVVKPFKAPQLHAAIRVALGSDAHA